MTELFRIVFFAFLFVGILGFLVNILDVTENPSLQTFDRDMEETFGDKNITGSESVWSMIPGAGIVDKALTPIFKVFNVFRDGLEVLPRMFKDFGVPQELIDIFKGALYILLGVALIKIYANRDVS